LLSGQASCPNWWTSLDTAGWSYCNSNLLLRSLYREPSTRGYWGAIDNCKCFSPTPNLAFADCYEQDASLSFKDVNRWAYCQRPGYFWQGMSLVGGAEISNLNKI